MRNHGSLNVLAGHGVWISRLPLGRIVFSCVLAPFLEPLLLIGSKRQRVILRTVVRGRHPVSKSWLYLSRQCLRLFSNNCAPFAVLIHAH